MRSALRVHLSSLYSVPNVHEIKLRSELQTSNYSNGLQMRFLVMDTVLCVDRFGRGRETHYGLDSSEIESWWGARFSAPFQTVLGHTQPPI
jgi:hypothetical protein